MKSPGRPDWQAFRAAYESVMRALARVVTDRRWAAPLSAMALGFGLFLGVAIGPGTDGSFATGAGQIVAVSLAEPEREREVENVGGSEGGGAAAAPRSEPAAEPFEAEAAFEPEPIEEFVPAAPSPEPEAEPAPPSPEPEAEEGGEGESVEVKGAVVRANPAAGSYTVATSAGELISIHAPKLPALGAKLEVEATPLPNNTFLEQQRSAGGRATGASLTGVVTHVDADPAAPAYTVSGRGSSILVHVAAGPAPELPAFGAYVKVGVRIGPAPSPAVPPAPEPVPTEPLPIEPLPLEPAPTCVADPALKAPPRPAKALTQRSIEAEPEPATYVDLAGIVSAICPESGELLLSADDLRSSEADLTLAVPKRIDTSGLKIGDPVLATATVEEDGGLSLAGLVSDERRRGAEDETSAQGDLKR